VCVKCSLVNGIHLQINGSLQINNSMGFRPSMPSCPFTMSSQSRLPMLSLQIYPWISDVLRKHFPNVTIRRDDISHGCHEMGIHTIKPFLQDVVRVVGLVGSLARSLKADLWFMPLIVAHVGIPTLVEWLGHVAMMSLSTVLHAEMTPVISPIVNKMEDCCLTYLLWRVVA
jgi:hypothetical protein